MEEKLIRGETFACNQCGADMHYAPGSTVLKCTHCGAESPISLPDALIEELDFNHYLSQGAAKADEMEMRMVKCESCGASSSVENNIKSAFCPYCSNPLILADAHTEHFLKPKSLLPFKIKEDEAKKAFKQWIKKLWFAPNALKRATLSTQNFKGVYMPFWTYDSQTTTQYTGMRGIHYYVTETYTAVENGKSVTHTRQVQKTRWYPAAGTVNHFFDDVLVLASESLPRKYVAKLAPWDLQNLVPFEPAFLSGFITEKYQLDLSQGFEQAKSDMQPLIEQMICQQIGGDVQRILSKRTRYDAITFKHLLLPCFVSAFRYKTKLFQFVVNARTGEVQGERPWSWTKIAALVLLILGLAAVGYYFYMNSQQQVQ